MQGVFDSPSFAEARVFGSHLAFVFFIDGIAAKCEPIAELQFLWPFAVGISRSRVIDVERQDLRHGKNLRWRSSNKPPATPNRAAAKSNSTRGWACARRKPPSPAKKTKK